MGGKELTMPQIRELRGSSFGARFLSKRPGEEHVKNLLRVCPGKSEVLIDEKDCICIVFLHLNCRFDWVCKIVELRFSNILQIDNLFKNVRKCVWKISLDFRYKVKWCKL